MDKARQIVRPRRGQTAYDRPDNLVLACRECNAAKADTPLMAFLLARRSRGVFLLHYGEHLSEPLRELADQLHGQFGAGAVVGIGRTLLRRLGLALGLTLLALGQPLAVAIEPYAHRQGPDLRRRPEFRWASARGGGWLSDRIGRSRVTGWAVLIFTVCNNTSWQPGRARRTAPVTARRTAS